MAEHFLPRILGKRQVVPAKHAVDLRAGASSISNGHHIEKTNSISPTKDPPHEELVAMVDIMLSDYALQHNATLRRALEVQSSDGFIALSALFSISRPCGIASLNVKTQSAIAQALRAASSRYETRLILTEPDAFWTTHESPSEAPKHTLTKFEPGGYEIRRSDWGKAPQDLGSTDSAHWRTASIYIENLPRGLNTASKIARFLQQQLLGFISLEDSDTAVVQQVCFSPPSFAACSDSEHDRPALQDDRCHSFAFAILRDSKLAESIVNTWPWDTAISSGQIDANAMTMEARRTGFRTLPIGEWVKLRDEYLRYQQQLSEAAITERETHYSGAANTRGSASAGFIATEVPANKRLDGDTRTQPLGSSKTLAEMTTPADTPTFPLGCLIFVKNIHPQTNKTTIKELLSHTFSSHTSPEIAPDGGGVDYVDYQKNMDTCHVRLGHPSLSDHLEKFFSSHTVYQTSALDGIGSQQGSSGGKPISVEVATGLKEKLYWDKLPEKVRHDAMKKARYLADGMHNDRDTIPVNKRPRKR